MKSPETLNQDTLAYCDDPLKILGLQRVEQIGRIIAAAEVLGDIDFIVHTKPEQLMEIDKITLNRRFEPAEAEIELEKSRQAYWSNDYAAIFGDGAEVRFFTTIYEDPSMVRPSDLLAMRRKISDELIAAGKKASDAPTADITPYLA